MSGVQGHPWDPERAGVPRDTARVKSEMVVGKRLLTSLQQQGGPFPTEDWHPLTGLVSRMSINRECAFRYAQDDPEVTKLLLKDSRNCLRQLRRQAGKLTSRHGLVLRTDVEVPLATTKMWRYTVPPILVERDLVTIVHPWRLPPQRTIGLLD